MTDAPRFSHAAEEAQHYKAQVQHMQDALREAENGLQEFMESSKELEAELEADIAQTSARADALQAENEALRADVDEWRSKYQQSLAEHNATLGELHRELSKLRESHDAYKTKLRDMELDNDELENAERMINSSLADMERQYNSAMERTALLESELEDKTRLEEENQRLKDELRDLREELAVRQRAAPAPAPQEVAEDTGADDDELQLSDLVTARRGAPSGKAYTLERLREHMRQLQMRLQNAQTATLATRPRAERSSLPRPRSSLSVSQSGAVSPRRTHTPLGRAETPVAPRPATPTSARAERRKSNSFIPVPANGLSRSQTRTRPPSRLWDAPSSAPGSAPSSARPPSVASPAPAVPYEFMEHDPSTSPVRRGSVLGRRRSMTHAPLASGAATSPSGLPRARAASPSKLRSPSKPGTSPSKPGTSPSKPAVPWR
ncbi:NADH:ubiquinone oxidoreductase [Malassezia brasiliensis]|uniref:NADH:ubiquinone oxidoreductase n=1 Tax=Malassezia brasiliensis TaxID=1821822 RepID=A0AAF0DVK7_9BASI|nr:NADH:ubiquinone oxidoreductase [Malassezia brasiliensis]